MITIKQPWEREDCMRGAKKMTQKAIDNRNKKKLDQRKEIESMTHELAHDLVSVLRGRVITS